MIANINSAVFMLEQFVNRLQAEHKHVGIRPLVYNTDRDIAKS